MSIRSRDRASEGPASVCPPSLVAQSTLVEVEPESPLFAGDLTPRGIVLELLDETAELPVLPRGLEGGNVGAC